MFIAPINNESACLPQRGQVFVDFMAASFRVVRACAVQTTRNGDGGQAG
jgi:hypothetical protein